MTALKLVIPTTFQLAEGPQWLAEREQLLWVDIEGREVHLFSPNTGEHDVIKLSQRVGAVIPTTSDELIVALEDGIYALDYTGKLTLLTELERDVAHNRCNDGKVDEVGRLWIGTMPMEGVAWTGSLYSYERSNTPVKHVAELGCSNGIDWSVDGRTMYFIDSPTRRVDAFDYDAEKGTISNRRPFIHIPETLGVPDGMCTDSVGRLWVAHWGGYCVTCWDPHSREEIKRITLPASQVTSCCFGGPTLNTLYITTASVGLSEQRLLEEPLAGSVFSIEVEETGKLNPQFKMTRDKGAKH
jgi:sugar lactone lactonase YvrE